MQRKSALTTKEMADARRELVALEARRLEADTRTLMVTRHAIDEEKRESATGAAQRSTSATMTHQVLGRLTAPNKG